MLYYMITGNAPKPFPLDHSASSKTTPGMEVLYSVKSKKYVPLLLPLIYFIFPFQIKNHILISFIENKS